MVAGEGSRAEATAALRFELGMEASAAGCKVEAAAAGPEGKDAD
jgi:hypothetical protein